MSIVPRGTWTRGFGVALVASDGPPGDGVMRALRDGIERGYGGELPSFPGGAQRLFVRVDGSTVGLLALQRDCPRPGAATFLAAAIDPACRGHGYGARAMLAAERRLRRDGVDDCYARMPRSNGRGLYFMLRCGYAPMQHPPVEDGAAWFRRASLPPEWPPEQ